MRRPSVFQSNLTKMLVDTYNLAILTKQASAAAQSVMGLAKLHGMIIDKTQVDALVRKPSPDPSAESEMSEDDWLAQYGAASAQSPSSEPKPDKPLN